MLPVFYVTFALEVGERGLSRTITQHAHPKGYATIAAPNRDAAMFMASFVYGKDGWVHVYEESEINFDSYPLGELAHFVAGEEPEPADDVLVTDNGQLLILGLPRIFTPGEASVLAQRLDDAAKNAVQITADRAAEAARLSGVGVKRHDDMF